MLLHAIKECLAPCKVIQESLGFRIPCLWIPDSTSMEPSQHRDTGFQQTGFWITIMVGFRIPLAGYRIPKPWILSSTDQNYLDSGLPYMGRHAIASRVHFVLFYRSLKLDYL